MNEKYMELLPNLISGGIALIALITTSYLAWNKHNYEERMGFQNKLKDKLELIYSPLKLRLDIVPSNELVFDTSTKDLVVRYGYLLTPKLLNFASDLISYEEKDTLNILDEEYLSLRERVRKEVNRGFNNLHKLSDKHFESYSEKYNLITIEKIGLAIKRSAIFITVSIYLCILLFSFYSYSTQDEVLFFNNKFVNFLFILLFFITMATTTIFLIPLIIQKTHETISYIFLRKVGYFRKVDVVSEKGYYQCLLCGDISSKIRYRDFGSCEQKHTIKQRVKGVFKFNFWKKIDV